MKPLGIKAYGSIPHLPGSRLGPGDHHCHDGQARIATEKVRDKHDIIIVQEKLDGSNVAVAKLWGGIHPLTKSGYMAMTSKYEQHHLFHRWVLRNYSRFNALLKEGERVCGEWLAQAHGTKYSLHHEPFVAFDIMKGSYRCPYRIFEQRAKEFDIVMPQLLSIGGPYSIELALDFLQYGGGHGALDPVEGAIWRVERKGEVDFLTKYVRHDKVDGKYFPENNGGKITWNI